MISKYTLGQMVTVDVVFRLNAIPTDPTAYDLVVSPPGEAPDVTYHWPDPPGPLGPIVRDSAGVFHADLLANTTGLWAYRFVVTGSGATAAEGQFYVQSVVSDAMDLLIAGEDFEAIRQLLAVTEVDVEDQVIESPVFGQQAELRVKMRVPTWETIWAGTDESQKLRLRYAVAYQTAALIADTFAQGGMIGLAHDGALEGRNWRNDALLLRETSESWLSEIEAIIDGPALTQYTVPMVRVTGPTRSSETAIAAPLRVPGWANGYPIVWGGWTTVSGD